MIYVVWGKAAAPRKVYTVTAEPIIGVRSLCHGTLLPPRASVRRETSGKRRTWPGRKPAASVQKLFSVTTADVAYIKTSNFRPRSARVLIITMRLFDTYGPQQTGLQGTTMIMIPV